MIPMLPPRRQKQATLPVNATFLQTGTFRLKYCAIWTGCRPQVPYFLRHGRISKAQTDCPAEPSLFLKNNTAYRKRSRKAPFYFQWSGWSDSNRRPPAPHAGTLTRLRYIPFTTTCIILQSRNLVKHKIKSLTEVRL